MFRSFYFGIKFIGKYPWRVNKAFSLPEYELIEGFGKRDTVGELLKVRVTLSRSS